MENQQVEYKKAFGKDVGGVSKDGHTVLLFEINEYPVKPVAYKNRYYKRVLNSNHLLSLEEIVDLQRDDYVSSLRNRLLAEAFYLTGDIERYGTGFVRIREHLQTYPEVSLSLEEVADFFRVVLQVRDLTPQDAPQASEEVLRSEKGVRSQLLTGDGGVC